MIGNTIPVIILRYTNIACVLFPDRDTLPMPTFQNICQHTGRNDCADSNTSFHE